MSVNLSKPVVGANPFTPTYSCSDHHECRPTRLDCEQYVPPATDDCTRCGYRHTDGCPFGDGPDTTPLTWTHVTATVSTASGSRYTVIVRRGFVVLMHEGDHWVRTGTDLHILGGRMYLRDNERDQTLVSTTTVTSVYVLEN